MPAPCRFVGRSGRKWGGCAAEWGKCGRRTGQEWKSACKPGSVVRERTGNHSSGRRVATPLEQPTRKRREPRHGFPIWPCPGWGFACRARYRTRGGLLPGVAARPKAHHFNLACASRPSAVCFLFHFPSPWAALSRGLLRPAVSRHPALRGPDFPPRLRAAVARRTSAADSNPGSATEGARRANPGVRYVRPSSRCAARSPHQDASSNRDMPLRSACACSTRPLRSRSERAGASMKPGSGSGMA